MTPAIPLMAVCLLLAGCVPPEPLPPALPADPVIFQDSAVPPGRPVESVLEPVPPSAPLSLPASLTPVITPTKDELARPKKSRGKDKPEQVIREANTQALATPTTAGYRDGRSVVQRYLYVPGQMYEIYSAPGIRPRLSSRRGNIWPLARILIRSMPGMSPKGRWGRGQRINSL